MNWNAGFLSFGVVLGAAATLAAPQTLAYLSPAAMAAASDTYRQLNLFGDVFDKIRNDYVEKPDESKLIEAALNGEEIVIAKGSKPVVRLVPVTRGSFRIGPLAGQLGAPPDFFEPMDAGDLDLWEGGR